MFKCQSPLQYSPFDAIHLSRPFFHCSKQFLSLSVLMPFSVSAVFCFSSPTSGKCFSLRTFFIRGNKKKSCLGKIEWIGRMGHGAHAVFGKKLLNTQCSVGRCACKSPIMKWMGKRIETVFKRNSLKPGAASHNNTSWYTDTGGFLELSPGGGAWTTRGPPSRR